MGVLYSVIPLTDSTRDWLDTLGVDTSALSNGRAPTPAEIRSVLNTSGLSVEWSSSGVTGPTAEIDSQDGASTLLRISNYKGDDDPCDAYFSKGSENLIHQITTAISLAVGPLLLYPDTGSGITVFDGQTRIPID